LGFSRNGLVIRSFFTILGIYIRGFATLIDWVTAEIPLLHSPIPAGRVTSTTEDGEEEWSVRRRSAVKGSFEKDISIRSDGGDGAGRATHLLLDGNPSKFLQGHNIFGSDDLVSLVYDTFIRCCRAKGLVPLLSELRAVKRGKYRILRIDINYSFELPTRADVYAWLRAAEFKSKTRHGRPSTKGGTLYWGKSSKRWALKAYSKGEEIQRPKYGLPTELKKTPLEKWADNKLRIELVLRSKQLDEINLSEARFWSSAQVAAIYSEYIARIKMTEQMILSDDVLHGLPKNIRGTYLLWRDGYDLRNELSNGTFYRHRKELSELGINIDLSPDKTRSANVVPLIKLVEAKQAPLPSWAFNQGLIHDSAILIAANRCVA